VFDTAPAVITDVKNIKKKLEQTIARRQVEQKDNQRHSSREKKSSS